MASKKKNKKTKKVKEKKNSKQIRYLEKDLEYTLKALNYGHPVIDEIFTNQANRIRAMIQKLEQDQ